MEESGAGKSEEQLQRSTKKVKTRNEGGESSSSDKESDEDPFDHCPEIKVSPKEFEKWCKPWQDSLVVRLLGKKISFQTMSTRLQNYWARDGSVNVIHMPNDYFLVQFSNEEDYKFALFEGPWMIMDHYLIVHRWSPFFFLEKIPISKVAVWVRIPNLPIMFYHLRFLRRVGKKLGQLLKVDHTTSLHSRGKFARICVEVDLSKKLVPKVKVMGHELFLEYEGLHLICFRCGRYSHKQEFCPESTVIPEVQLRYVEPEGEMALVEASTPSPSLQDQINPTPNMDNQGSIPQNSQIHSTAQNQEGYFGLWMLVKIPQRRRPIRDNNLDPQDQRRAGKGPISQGAPNKDPKKNPATRTVLTVSQPSSGPAPDTPKPKVDKSEEKSVLALMKQFQKIAKDSNDSSKSNFHQESLLPDNETLQFIANQHRRLKFRPPPQEPPDPGPTL
ncbi:hypothetical protein SESBI_13607 [Sesbania bispinosa]|nr:hypothetical protein SESBI_13607 [Sesbania bispinosa]